MFIEKGDIMNVDCECFVFLKETQRFVCLLLAVSTWPVTIELLATDVLAKENIIEIFLS
jgi:hypothetical protein